MTDAPRAASADRPSLAGDAARLDGKVAVVTGGGAGIGRGIAEGFATFGASVAIWEQDPATAAEVAAAVGGLAVVVDVRDGVALDAALATTLDRFGQIDVLVNNAGGAFHRPLLTTSDNGFDALHRANLGHVLRATRRVAGSMVERGSGGSIINVTSIEGVRAAPGYAAYAAAKAGVVNFTQTAAVELATYGIRVNALAPDVCLTEGLAALAAAGVGDEPARDLGAGIPMGRAGTVADLAGAAVFLASDLSAYVTGHTLHVDGGTHAAGGWYRLGDDWVLGPR
ncbi:MAG TPA: SDR family oxidoreductase [Acidimicrobiales bacterium]|nr:SDR family oxidoreductase [Acidimicrobiales bacterium]